jgi:hypothetical protein
MGGETTGAKGLSGLTEVMERSEVRGQIAEVKIRLWLADGDFAFYLCNLTSYL